MMSKLILFFTFLLGLILGASFIVSSDAVMGRDDAGYYIDIDKAFPPSIVTDLLSFNKIYDIIVNEETDSTRIYFDYSIFNKVNDIGTTINHNSIRGSVIPNKAIPFCIPNYQKQGQNYNKDGMVGIYSINGNMQFIQNDVRCDL